MSDEDRSLPMSAFGRLLPVINLSCAGQVECKRLVSTNAIHWSVAMQKGGQVECNSPPADLFNMAGVFWGF